MATTLLSDKEAIFCTSLLADTIADEGTSLENVPLGSGRLVSFCFAKYFNRAISFNVQTSHVQKQVKNFRGIKFRGFTLIRENSEN